MRNKRLFSWGLLAALAAIPLQTAAQESTATHLFGIGSTSILDTYISQEKFSGTGLTYLYIREREKPDKHWGNIIEHEINLSNTKDRSEKTSELEGGYNLYWGRYRQWNFLSSTASSALSTTHRPRTTLLRLAWD